MATKSNTANERKTSQDLENKYRLPTESKNQWDLRKRFLENYWDKYDEDRLLCLAQCYVNMRCLGCKYSKSLDSLIEELAKEIE
ncbi:unnamed protein product [Rotaria sordida]|uniref:XRN2-binding (XTBD) domain-containing protein n=2 Tax=Rotaria sordida TaxID=392033 RepID=A0A813N180_9BILA|nr:unnamed protein product [Rotaria sordida]CAF0762552.1 unnamed protein product [Rotaria sordida]CAF0789007.1 unnamed protein product [Rotaria sordida]CAF3474070.1 unnamed protein product [Rotaria sordida]CAF3532799.1 unnamed protein product [Rotaria sordida]